MQDRIKLASKESCTGCATCASICPKGCIKMKEDREGFLQPKIDSKVCVRCHQCEKTCPILNPLAIPSDFETKAYAAINKDEEVRMRSSSGGMFHALAKWTIEQGGVVFGARFDEKWEVMHGYTETIEGIEPFMRSKYVQSRVGETFKQAKQFLEQGRWVLFSGTPCQIGGLQAFLGKEYERLIKVDLICYGVPSPRVWRNYLNEYEHKYGHITNVSFRDKTDGWNRYKCVITTMDGKGETPNVFVKGFFEDLFIRRSCYACRFRLLQRNSDLTIADYWGVEKYCPNMFDNKGTSIVFTHSIIGEKVLFELTDKLCLLPQSVNNAREYNPCMDLKNPKSVKRKRFFELSRLYSFDKVMLRIEKDSFCVRVRRKVTKYLNLCS